ncbi:winged helix-turn-helix transcriptional regulator [bacterium]|nr:winged helix-turn-helix transcriptional regulator [bacterium]
MPRGIKKNKLGMGGPMMCLMADPRSRFFMALASGQRIKILELLKEGEKSSADIIHVLELDASVVSRHLMMLRNVGLVSARKEGVTLYFSIADIRVFQILDLTTESLRDWFEQRQSFF